MPDEYSDQPGHPPSLIRVFAVCMKKAWVLSYPLSAPQSLCSDWPDAQADLSLRWVHMPFCLFGLAAQLTFALHSSYAVQYLQPDISKYASEILPLLFQYLLQVSQDAEKNPKGLTRSYYALEMFCENLGKNLGNYRSF